MRKSHLAIPVAAAAVLAAGCGGVSGNPSAGSSSSPASSTSSAPSLADLSATQILAKAKTALQAAQTVHITGSGFENGEQFGIDMRLKGRDGGAGTITFNGATIELLRIGKTIYFKASEQFWRAQTGNATAANLLKGKYLKAGIDNADFKELGSFTDLSVVAKEVLNPDGTISKDGRKTIRGTEAIGLIDHGKDGGTLWVALTGEPLPLQIASNRKTDNGGMLDFLDYGKPVQLTTPPADLVIDVSELGGR